MDYLMIQTYPCQSKLIVKGRYSDFDLARSACELENQGDDYTSSALRVQKDGKLYCIDSSGLPSTLSLQQDWLVLPEYKNHHNDDSVEGEIIVCRCTYPYFMSENYLTCLVDDSGREINYCPNCYRTLSFNNDDC
jgi:hypothetical protein